MPASTSRAVARLAATAILLVVVAGGCAGQAEESTTASQATTISTMAPPTTIPPLTAEERALLEAVTALREKIEKAFSATHVYMTRAKMTSYASTLRSCSRELARIGSPSDRLEPVYALVKKACRTFDKGAKCFATAARVSGADGSVLAGSPAARTQQKALECGGAAQGDGFNLLVEADAIGKDIRTRIA